MYVRRTSSFWENAVVRKLVMLVLAGMLPVCCAFGGRSDGQPQGVSEEAANRAEHKVTSVLPESISSMTIHSGEEFALMRDWYDWETLNPYGYVRIVFSEDLEDWLEEDLEALAILKCNVYVESSGKTVPARALSYLTGATSLFLGDDSDMTDVSGTMPEGREFPEQIKTVTFMHYREGKYKTLLRLLQDSQVETVGVFSDTKAVWTDTASKTRMEGESEPEVLQGFWLDDVAGVSTLKEVVLREVAIRVRDERTLAGFGLERIEGCVDGKTEIGFVEQLTRLKELECDITEKCDLQPLFQKEGAELFLRFQEECPAFYQAVLWPEDKSGERTPHSYQRRYDQGRMAECFISWRDDSDDEIFGIAMGSNNPCLRVTDGDAVYEFRPGETESNAPSMYLQEGRMRFQDINFDGTKDLVMPAERFGPAGLTATEYAYLWNQGSGRYEFSPSYCWIDDPEVDEEQQLIRSEQIYWPIFHNWTIYRYVDGEFVRQSALTEETLEEDEIPEELAVPEGAEVIRWQEKIFKNGETAETKNAYAVQIEGEETVFPQRCKSYYEKDSYWAGYDPDIWEGKRETPKEKEEESQINRNKRKPYSLTIHSGEEFASVRDLYDWDGLEKYDYVRVVFSEDMKEWQEEELETLGILKGTVYVESSGETFPARALTYLTGAREVIVSGDSDMTDVSGTLPEGREFPKQIQAVTLMRYREGKYRTLLRVLQDSQVETIEVAADYGEEYQEFWLDDAAAVGPKEIVLERAVIRVRDEKALEDCLAERIQGYVDAETDLGFAARLPALEELTCTIIEERDLRPALDREGLSLYLELLYLEEEETPEARDGEEMPCIYQRRYDQGRMVECFTEWQGEDGRLCDPWLRVTDGAAVYELRPEVSELFGYGDYREDRMELKDINFDGIKDITLETGRYGNQGVVYDYGWIWNQNTGRYEYSPTYRDIANPSVDAEHQLVRSVWRNWAASHSWAIYRYVDGAYVMQSELTEEYIAQEDVQEELGLPEKAGLIRWQEWILESEGMGTIKNAYAVLFEGAEDRYPKVYESYFAQDSYWGGD